MATVTKVDLVEKLKYFAQTQPRNKWIFHDAYKVYVRRDRRAENFWLASVEVYTPGKGIFRNVILPAFEDVVPMVGYKQLAIEDVLDNRFANFFRKRGYREQILGGIPSFYKTF